MSPISVVLPILAPTPFLRALAEFTIKTLRLHADDPSFELVVAESTYDHFERFTDIGTEDDRDDQNALIDKYLNFTPPVGGVKETNAAIDAARGDFIVYTGSDVIVPQGWDTELLRVFEERPKDCGIANLASYEPGAMIGPREELDMIVEGMYSPFAMWRKGWRLDEAYLRCYQDSDLVMRMYDQGLRAFRSCRKHVHHLGSMSTATIDSSTGHNAQLVKDEALFYQRWGKSPLMMYAMIRWGQQTYGKEHEAWVHPIQRHM